MPAWGGTNGEHWGVPAWGGTNGELWGVQHEGASTGRTGMRQQGSTWVLMGWYDPNLALFSGAG